jgi:hypothetical protein
MSERHGRAKLLTSWLEGKRERVRKGTGVPLFPSRESLNDLKVSHRSFI